MREEALLAQVRVLTDKHDALAAATGQSFNLFKILDRETDEVKTHSAILAELLDPNGSHGQGAVFAEMFAKRIEVPAEAINSARVRREVTVADGSRVDILMQTDDTCVVIENKIYAGDQPRQLERYHAYASQWHTYKVIYLSLHGGEPSDDSLGTLSPDEVTCTSYAGDVLSWLDDCIKEVAGIPQVREILANYQALLRKLTGKSTGELVMDLKKLLSRKQGDFRNYDLVPQIAEAMTALSIETEWKFWQKLQRRLLKVEHDAWRLTLVDDATASSPRFKHPFKRVDEKVVRHAHGNGNNKWYYGWTFRIESNGDVQHYVTDRGELLLRVEVDEGGWGRYGFIAAVQTPDGLRRLTRADDVVLFECWRNHLSELGTNTWDTNRDEWVAWAYPDEDVDLRKGVGWLAPCVIRNLRKTKQAIRPLVCNIQRTISASTKAAARPRPQTRNSDRS